MAQVLFHVTFVSFICTHARTCSLVCGEFQCKVYFFLFELQITFRISLHWFRVYTWWLDSHTLYQMFPWVFAVPTWHHTYLPQCYSLYSLYRTSLKFLYWVYALWYPNTLRLQDICVIHDKPTYAEGTCSKIIYSGCVPIHQIWRPRGRDRNKRHTGADHDAFQRPLCGRARILAMIPPCWMSVLLLKHLHSLQEPSFGYKSIYIWLDLLSPLR